MSHNVSHVCDVAPSPTRARGHVAQRRAAAPRSPSRPAGAAMYIRAVICRCAEIPYRYLFSLNDMLGASLELIEQPHCPTHHARLLQHPY
jgi:hypothetical protein